MGCLFDVMLQQERTMRDDLINATELALKSVTSKRFFQTERGFHGRFYCALQRSLDQAGLMNNGAILEMEYQKSARHGTRQRPDIVFHIPAEYSNSSVRENNFAVWALKRRASPANALEDFANLDEMFNNLCYQIGIFVNIDSTDPMRQHYTGQHQKRLSAVATCLTNSQVKYTGANKIS